MCSDVRSQHFGTVFCWKCEKKGKANRRHRDENYRIKLITKEIEDWEERGGSLIIDWLALISESIKVHQSNANKNAKQEFHLPPKIRSKLLGISEVEIKLALFSVSLSSAVLFVLVIHFRKKMHYKKYNWERKEWLTNKFSQLQNCYKELDKGKNV